MIWTVERHDQEDGSITYEIWCYDPDHYERICSINTEFDTQNAKKWADHIVALHNGASL